MSPAQLYSSTASRYHLLQLTQKGAVLLELCVLMNAPLGCEKLGSNPTQVSYIKSFEHQLLYL